MADTKTVNDEPEITVLPKPKSDGESGSDSKSNTESKVSPKILVADDERPLSKALELKLTRSGFTVVVANNGVEALEKIAVEKFDLIILDLIMPRVDGFGVLTKLKEQGNKTPVVVISNLSQNDDITKAKALGALEFFTKSNMPLTDIVNYIAQVLHYEPQSNQPAGDIAA